MTRTQRGCAVMIFSALAWLDWGRAAEPKEFAAVGELKRLSLEELIETPVISVSRVPESWFTAPTAVDMTTGDEIRRTGVVRLPDALRYITGLQVARFSGSSYAITARGFNGTAANKLQVMLDGRSLYTPLFSGVFWQVQDTLLEDIERIETVRGPGATLWGANSVNGVINILTKSARDTQGLLVTGGAGNEEQFLAGVRYGGRLAENSFYRVYVKQNERDDQVLANGMSAMDASRHTQIGFRTDSYFHGTDQLTVQGDAYVNEGSLMNRDDEENRGGNFLARWSRDLAEYGDVIVQSYYDRGVRDVPLQFAEDRQTFDLDAQHHFTWRERQSIVWGATYRVSWDDTGTDQRTFQFHPEERTIHLISGFIQDDITLIEDWLRVGLGSKFEYNDFTGFEVQPGARAALTPHEHHTIWASVSRAVRTPTRLEDDLRFSPSTTGSPLVLRGDRGFVSEELLAYEAGYRVQAFNRVSLDVSAFYNQYQHLRTIEPTPGRPGGIPFVIRNLRHGDTYGAELAAKIQLHERVRVSASYTRLVEELEFSRRSNDPTGGSGDANDPDDFAVVALAIDLPCHVEVDVFMRYMDALPNPRVPSYVMWDVRLGWRPTKNFEVSFAGHNLNDPSHREFGARTGPEVERSFFGRATLRF